MDAIKDYLIGMVESWNNDHSNVHAGITSIVSSFGSKKDYKYLSLRLPSNLDSGVGTGPSTSSLPRRSRPSKESPLAATPPLYPPRPKMGQLHKLSLQESHKSPPEEMHRNTVASLMPVGEVERPSNTFPRTSHHELPSRRERRMNQPVMSHARRSYVFGDPIQRRISAPWKLVSGLGARHNPMERQGSGGRLSNHQASDHPPVLPQRSHSSTHSPNYPPPLPQRRHSDSVSSNINTLTRFSPTLDDFNEDEEEDDDDAQYSIIGALDYIAPRQHAEGSHKNETKCRNVEGRPNISKLQKKLWKRNSTFKKGKRPSVHKRSLVHSSDASSDDSDTTKNKPKPQRRISSYHPTYRRVSVVKPVRRRTAGAFPNLDLQLEDAELNTANVGQSSTLHNQIKVKPNIALASDGDNEESELNSGNNSRVRHI